MKIIRESDHLYRLTRFGMVNCFLLEHDHAFTLIDTNLPGSANSILDFAKTLNLPIQRILLTHAHFDHVASLEALASYLPGVEIAIGAREARFLAGDFSLEKNERGRKLFGFMKVKSRPTGFLNDGDRIGPLLAISSPGHTPGHFSYLDVRDNTLIAGDAFTTQNGLLAAGVFQWTFPFPFLFSWNAELSAQSAARLRDAKPTRLCVGHGKTSLSPATKLDQAIAKAFQQHPAVKQQ